MDWRDKLSGLKANLPVVEEPEIITTSTVAKKLQKEPLRIEQDKRKGKIATLITGYEGSDEELKELAKKLKITCGAGGSSRDGEILIQGDFRIKIAEILTEMGFKIRKINFK